MKYRIISVAKVKEPFYLNGIREYMKRLKPYANIELIDGLEERISPHAGDKEIEKSLQKESLRLLNLIPADEAVIVLDIKGEAIDSNKLAAYVRELNDNSSINRVNIIIGSSFGLDVKVKQRADRIVSFSFLTFPHQMAVLILTEQIYRAFKIIRNEPYHK